MKELLELRINQEFSGLLFGSDEGKNLGTSIKIIEISKEDPRYFKIPIIAEMVKREYNKTFFFGWKIKRKYNKKELDTSKLLTLKVKKIFEPTGEEQGTQYDETVACNVCGAGRKQIGSLILKKGSLPEVDIAKTIGGELIVSEKFVESYKAKSLNGVQLEKIYLGDVISDHFQLNAKYKVKLANQTIVGINPFDLSGRSNDEIYECPNKDTLGLNLISEVYVENNSIINDYDFLCSEQKIGVKRGLLRPEPLYFCSQNFRRMVAEKELTGFEFEVAHTIN